MKTAPEKSFFIVIKLEVFFLKTDLYNTKQT